MLPRANLDGRVIRERPDREMQEKNLIKSKIILPKASLIGRVIVKRKKGQTERGKEKK